MRLVPIECVMENSKLGKTIYDSDGNIMLKRGVILTKLVIKK